MRGPMATRRRPLAHELLHCRLEEVRPVVRVREGYAVQPLTVVPRRRECGSGMTSSATTSSSQLPLTTPLTLVPKLPNVGLSSYSREMTTKVVCYERFRAFFAVASRQCSRASSALVSSASLATLSAEGVLQSSSPRTPHAVMHERVHAKPSAGITNTPVDRRPSSSIETRFSAGLTCPSLPYVSTYDGQWLCYHTGEGTKSL
jgi:hypothetical protein